MDLVKVATSRLGPEIATTLANLLPRQAAYGLADILAGILARQKNRPLTRSLSANMAMVYGLPVEDQEVQDAVGRLLKNQLRCYVDLYRAIKAGPDALQSACELDEEAQQALQDGLDKNRGLLLVGTHSCSFDMFFMALPKLVPSVQALTKAEPEGSTDVVNALRREFGVEITPISKSALRQAINRLKSGGVVAIAADLPEQGGQRLEFFGQKCEMPVGHARLAIKTGAQMVVCTSYRSGPGKVRAKAALVDRPPSSGDTKQDAVRWAQAALTKTESFIRERPDDWFVPEEFHPGHADIGPAEPKVSPAAKRLALTRPGFGG